MSTNEDVLGMLDELQEEAQTKKSKAKLSKKNLAASKSHGSKVDTTSAAAGANGNSNASADSIESTAPKSPVTPRKSVSKDRKNEDDIMGFLENLTKDSRGGTPETATEKPIETENVSSESESAAKLAPSPLSEVANPITSITSWWSRNKDGLWDTATQAVKQAEARVKSHEQTIQKFGLSKEILQSTLSSVLETIAPPISRHEQLKIHIFHDIVGYPAIDSVVYAVFERVMEQVEGGDLEMVVQKGKERHRRGSDASQDKNLNLFQGPSSDAIKLAKANIEAIAVTTETLALDSDEDVQDGSPKTTRSSKDAIRTSNVFLSIQPTTTKQENVTSSTQDKKEPINGEETSTLICTDNAESFSFVVHLMDVINKVEFTAMSQPMPLKWVEWLETTKFEGSVDPREYVLEWIEEALALAVGVVAQSYVTRRMGCL